MIKPATMTGLRSRSGTYQENPTPTVGSLRLLRFQDHLCPQLAISLGGTGWLCLGFCLHSPKGCPPSPPPTHRQRPGSSAEDLDGPGQLGSDQE